MSYLINLLNTKTTTNTIINKKTTLNSCIQDFESIFNHLIKQENTEIKSTIVQGNTPSMIIFTSQDKIIKGYLYNSTCKEQVNLYEISLIPINIELTNLMNPIFTPFFIPQKHSFKRICHDKLKRRNMFNEREIYPIFENEYQPLLSNSTSPSPFSSSSSSSSMSPNKKLLKFNPLEFNQEFVDELKQKLNQLNFGLK